MNNDFPRIKRLPPYVFNITNELKMAARHRGEDIIDLSMGNPDGDTPKHIVDKMIEVAQRPGHTAIPLPAVSLVFARPLAIGTRDAGMSILIRTKKPSLRSAPRKVSLT